MDLIFASSGMYASLAPRSGDGALLLSDPKNCGAKVYIGRAAGIPMQRRLQSSLPHALRQSSSVPSQDRKA